jgi:hypothetical protein
MDNVFTDYKKGQYDPRSKNELMIMALRARATTENASAARRASYEAPLTVTSDYVAELAATATRARIALSNACAATCPLLGGYGLIK